IGSAAALHAAAGPSTGATPTKKAGTVAATGAGAGVPAGAPVAEAPALAPRVEAGQLPPLARRLPERPLVLETDPDAVYGGDLRMLVGTLKDTKLFFIYGYARLIRFDQSYRIVP